MPQRTGPRATVRCEHCRARIRLPLSAAGRTARCPRCEQAFRVPDRLRPDEPATSETATRDNGTIRFACEHCDASVKVPATAAGRRAKCPRCAAVLVVPSDADDPRADSATMNLAADSDVADDGFDDGLLNIAPLDDPTPVRSSVIKPIETGPAPVCPSCKRKLAPGAKICVECGIYLKSGRPILTTQDDKLNEIYEWAQQAIAFVSWIVWVGIYPIASEAFGTRKPYVVRTIAILTILTSLAYWAWTISPAPSQTREELMLWGGSGQVDPKLKSEYEDYGMAVGEFRPHQLITHAFLHGGIEHLVGNLIFFMVLGSRVNSLLGNWWTLGLYPFFAVVAGLAELHFGADRPPYPMLGASGAIMGMAGMYFILFPIHKVHMAVWVRWGLVAGFRLSLWLFAVRGFWVVGSFIALDVTFTLLGAEDGTAHWAHLGGFVAGVAVALILLFTRLINARGGDLLSVTLGHRAWVLIGRPNRQAAAAVPVSAAGAAPANET